MKIKLHLTEDHLKLIPFFYIGELNHEMVGVTKEPLFCLGSHLLEDMAMILGKMDKAIPNTEHNPNGRAFDDETEKYMLDIHQYMVENLTHIETLIHQFVTKGGLTPGTYECIDREFIWIKKED